MSGPPSRAPPPPPPRAYPGGADASPAAAAGEAGEEEEAGSTFKAAPKVGMSELLQKDADDESLRKYKEQLLGEAAKGGGSIGDPNDPRRVVITEMRVNFEDRPGGDIVYALNTKQDVENLKNKPFVLKEKCMYRLQISFRVQHDIVSGLKFTNKVYKAGIRVAKEEEMLGSYAPQAEPYMITVPRRTWEEAPSGWLARGGFKAESAFSDDDGVTHLAYGYAFELKTDWK